MTPSPVPQLVPYTATQQTCGCGINPGGGCTVSIPLHRKQLPSSGGRGGLTLLDDTLVLFTLQRLTCDQKTTKTACGYVRICQSRITLSPCPPKPRVKPKAISQQPHHHNLLRVPSPTPREYKGQSQTVDIDPLNLHTKIKKKNNLN